MMNTRRDILQKMTVTGLTAALGGAVSNSVLEAKRDAYPTANVSVQAYHDALSRLERHTAEQIPRTNLFHAWETIAPTRFNEYVFVTWCGTRHQPTGCFAQEFASRRRGAPSRLPDHVEFNISQHMFGNWRLPVYREHRLQVIANLTHYESIALNMLEKRWLHDGLSLPRFRSMVFNQWPLPESVRDDDIPILWEGLQMTAKCVLPLSYCAMLTGRVLDFV